MGTEIPENGADEGEEPGGGRKAPFPWGGRRRGNTKCHPWECHSFSKFTLPGALWRLILSTGDVSSTFQLLMPMDPHFPDNIPSRALLEFQLPLLTLPAPGVPRTQDPAANISKFSRDLQLGILARHAASLQDEPRRGEKKTLELTGRKAGI